MQGLSTLLELPQYPMHKIIFYLTRDEVFGTLARVCKKFAGLIRTSNLIPAHLISLMVGGSPQIIKDLENVPQPHVLRALKSLYNVLSFELPYFAFKVDGGCADPRYNPFHHAFESTPQTYISSDIGDASECHVQGVLSMNYLVLKNREFPKPRDEAEEKKIAYYSALKPLLPNDSQTRKMIEKAALEDSKCNIELPYKPFEGISTIITSLDFTDICAEPSYAMAIFCSNEKIDFDDPCLKFFQKMRTPKDLEAVYEKSKLTVPKIESTNIESLQRFARNKKYPMIINPSIQAVFFTNPPNQLSPTVRPIAWIKASQRGFTEIDLPKGNYFTGRFIAVKMLTDSSESQPKNIRFYGMSVRGRIIPAEDWLVDAVKPPKKPSHLRSLDC